jgi:hypothetical protein
MNFKAWIFDPLSFFHSLAQSLPIHCRYRRLLLHLIILNDANSVGIPWTRDRPIAEAYNCTVHNIYKRQTSMPPVRFEPAIPANERGANLCLKQRGHRHQSIFDLWAQIYSFSCTRMLFVVRECVLLHHVACRTGLLLKLSVKQERNVYLILYPQLTECFGSSWNHQANIPNNSCRKVMHIWHQLITAVIKC